MNYVDPGRLEVKLLLDCPATCVHSAHGQSQQDARHAHHDQQGQGGQHGQHGHGNQKGHYWSVVRLLSAVLFVIISHLVHNSLPQLCNIFQIVQMV